MTTAYKPARAAGLAILCLAATASAHEHHMDDIPEGQYVSSDPIVRIRRSTTDGCHGLAC